MSNSAPSQPMVMMQANYSLEDIPTLEETIGACLDTPELIKEYKRLFGAGLCSGSPINNAIDEATGYKKKEYFEFFEFVKKYVWKPLVIEMVHEIEKKQNNVS